MAGVYGGYWVSANEVLNPDETQRKILPHAKIKSDRTYLNHTEIILFKFAASVFWLYLLINTFIVNLDAYFLDVLPWFLVYLVSYKLVFFMAVILVAVFLLPKGRILFYFFYILFFPIHQFIRLCFSVFRTGNWSLTISFCNVLIGLFAELKSKFVFFSFLTFSIFLLFFVEKEMGFYFSVSLLIGLLIYVYTKGFSSALNPSNAVRMFGDLLSERLCANSEFFAMDKDAKDQDLINLTHGQRQARQTKLEFSVVHNRVCLFTAHKLKEYQISGWRLLPQVYTVLSVLFWNIFLFSLIFYAIWKINPSDFNVSIQVRYFDFFYFSFNNLIFNSVAEIRPLGDLARVFYMIQIASLFLVLVIFMSSYFSHQSERYTADIDKAIDMLNKGAHAMEGHIRAEFRERNVDAAILSLKELKSVMLTFVLKITEGIKAD